MKMFEILYKDGTATVRFADSLEDAWKKFPDAIGIYHVEVL